MRRTSWILAYGFSKQPEKALECFIALTDAHPDDAQGWYQVSVALDELGRNEEALSALRKAFKLDQNDASIAFNLGMTLSRVQDTPDEALVYLRRAEDLGHRRAHQTIAYLEELKSGSGEDLKSD